MSNKAVHIQRQIDKQRRFIEMWNPILDVLKNSTPEDAVITTAQFIQNKIDAVQALLDNNIKALEAIQA